MELLAVMVMVLVAAAATLPAWPYAARWGYYPTGACGAVLLTLVGLILTGRF
jgi:bacteriorhodopsin